MSVRDTCRLLHTMLRVRDLDLSLGFYCGKLGMSVRRRLEFPRQRFSLVYVGFGDDHDATMLELTHNWDQTDPYTHGTGYGHVGIGVANLDQFCSRLKQAGVTMPRPPGEMLSSGIRIAFLEDPDGYKVELIELPFPKPHMAETVTFE